MIKRILKIFSFRGKVILKERHWTDDWEKARYRIEIYLDSNDIKNYRPQRKDYNEHEWKYITPYPSLDIQIATNKIGEDKKFFQKAWNIHYIRKYEYIDVL